MARSVFVLSVACPRWRVFMPAGGTTLNNAQLASVPHHPFLQRLMQRAVAAVIRGERDPLYAAGPHAVTAALKVAGPRLPMRCTGVPARHSPPRPPPPLHISAFPWPPLLPHTAFAHDPWPGRRSTWAPCRCSTAWWAVTLTLGPPTSSRRRSPWGQDVPQSLGWGQALQPPSSACTDCMSSSRLVPGVGAGGRGVQAELELGHCCIFT